MLRPGGLYLFVEHVAAKGSVAEILISLMIQKAVLVYWTSIVVVN